MTPDLGHEPDALLANMFDVEMRVMRSEAENLDLLVRAFHPDVVIHEPASLPYPGDWTGVAGVRALLRKMNETWSDMSVDGMRTAATGDTVLLTCTLRLVARASGAIVTQPFAEALRFKDGRLLEGTPFYFDTHELIRILAPA